MPPQSVRDRLSAQQGGRCAICTRPFGPDNRPHCDHIVPLRDGGLNRQSNMQMLCAWCHVEKTAAENTSRAKVNRVRAKHLGIADAKTNRHGRGFQTNRTGRFKKKMDGSVVERT
jgi:5-methylcytosine-specific restriction endonuclease McrA